ncbi:MAG: ATP-binding protein [Lentisphaerae bacterium]|jgi:predicted AAA+ superfamily ATPase|nr:ATP-binding protein [Lentisphaerota bacterium]
MIKRELTQELTETMRAYPVVTLTGPRQAGKTTLARWCFPSFSYASLEDPQVRELAVSDPVAFFARYPEPVIIDEIQRVPEITSWVQVRVDEDRKRKGRFLLTGSHQPELHQAVSQSLAGRTAILNLMPLSVSEVLGHEPQIATDALLLRGFMPEVHDQGMEPTRYYRNYYKTYVERDLRQLAQIRNLAPFERFMTLLAGRVGQVVNLSRLTGETGVSSTTLAGWLSILEASFLVFRLQPFFSNISKRTVKSPKIYFTEVGLASYLLGLETPQQVSRDPLRGNLFENLVVADILKSRLNIGKEPNLFYLRTEKGFEVDLIMREGRTLRPVEIKSAATFNSEFTAALRRFCTAEPEAADPLLIYDGENFPERNGVRCANFRAWRGGAGGGGWHK